MLYNSSINLLRRYQKTRVPWVIFVPLALFLCVANATGYWPFDAATWCLNWIMALCLVIHFRLWDDLADVEYDRRIHPERVLCQADSHQVFWCILGLFLIVNTVLIASFKPIQCVGVFLVLNASYFIWYSLLRKMISDWVVSHLIVLAKYPVFVFLLSGSHSDSRAGLSLGYGMSVTFLCFCAYELQHDQRLRAERHARSLLACDYLALWFFAISMLIELRRQASNLAVVQAGLLAVGSIVLLYLLQRYRLRAAPGLWCFGVFFVAFVWLLNFALGSRGPFALQRGDLSETAHLEWIFL